MILFVLFWLLLLGQNQNFPGASTSSVMISIDTLGAKSDSGTTDNTTIINNAIAGLSDGVGLYFPCTNGGYYYVTGQIVFKGHHTYQGGPARSSTNACSIVSNYSGNDAAFLFVGAGYVNLFDLRFVSGNSASPPYTIVTFGSTDITENGSDYEMRGMMFSGYASKAAWYSIGSEVVRDYGTRVALSGGGALYGFYTADTDVLSACPSCYSGGPLSNTAQWHYGDRFTDSSATATTHYNIAISGTSSSDMLFDGGYIASQVNGAASSGYGFYFPSTNGGLITINGIRNEQSIAFLQVASTVNVNHLTITNNTISTTLNNPAFFVDASVSGTGTAIIERGNRIKTPTGVDSASGIGSTWTGLTASEFNEPFTITTSGTYSTPGSRVTSNSVDKLGNIILQLINTQSQPTCNASARGYIFQVQSNVATGQDALQFCVRTDSGNYQWENISLFPPNAVTFTPGTNVTSVICQSATCDVNAGEFQVVGGTATTGVIATVNWPYTYTTAPRVCVVTQNSASSTLFDLGHGTPSITGITINANLSVSGQTFLVDYECRL